jgi:hypothetical protein
LFFHPAQTFLNLVGVRHVAATLVILFETAGEVSTMVGEKPLRTLVAATEALRQELPGRRGIIEDIEK